MVVRTGVAVSNGVDPCVGLALAHGTGLVSVLLGTVPLAYGLRGQGGFIMSDGYRKPAHAGTTRGSGVQVTGLTKLIHGREVLSGVSVTVPAGMTVGLFRGRAPLGLYPS